MIAAVLEALRTTVVELVPAALIFIALAAVVKRDRLVAGFMAARREVGTNLGLMLFNGVVMMPLIAVPLTAYRRLIPRDQVLIAFWSALPAVLTIILAIVLIDLAAYWRHRLEHSPALWRIHATHHADEAMNWLTLHRKHPLGELLSLLIDLVPVLLLGLPIWAILTASLLRAWWGYLIHADVPWTLGPVGKVMMSPAAHRLHHIRDEALMGANFGNTITLWDRLFGTWTDPAPYLNCKTGIAEGTRDLGGELLRPFEARYWKAKPQAAAEPAE
ncbi:sterol desaturase family protein [Erythrobacter tepidarius]|uniref:sterol desaturase family protein n=1 Tax=Erythrobacter tepidarius TaxID=60454 RepID=UPI000A3C56FF|nr:sterol desaturase family protein [Erythrobacter tepidarius]